MPIDNLILIDPLPTTPNHSMSDAEFVAAADAWVAAQGDCDAQRNAQAQQLNTLAAEVQANKAATDANVLTSSVTKWLSGTSYTAGQAVWSPIDFQTYRRKVNGSGTTDPKNDATNWAAMGNALTVGGFSPSQAPAANQIPVLAATGDLPAPGGVRFGNLASSDPNVPNWYEFGNFDATSSGGSVAITANVKFVRFGSLVVMSLPVFSLDSNSASFTLGTIPTTVRPSANRRVPVRVRDNGGTIVWGHMVIGSNGLCTVYKDANSTTGNWTATTGSKVLYDSDISYTL